MNRLMLTKTFDKKKNSTRKVIFPLFWKIYCSLAQANIKQKFDRSFTIELSIAELYFLLLTVARVNT